MQQAIQSVLDFWFGDIETDTIPQDKWGLWFGSNPKDDDDLQQTFSSLITQAVAGDLHHWQESDTGKVAHIILCDQMTRATLRGTPQAFSGDTLARSITLNGIANGNDKKMPVAHRLFFYLPLEHSENITHQQQCLTCYQQLIDEHPQLQTILQRSLQEAEKHHQLIQNFGRFPHRNAVLGRDNTPAEADYLATTHNHYGQAPR